MFKFFTEAELPKLSQTSLFEKMNQDNSITTGVKEELKNASKYRVMPDDIPEIVALMKLNGDASIKKALKMFSEGSIVVLFHPESTKIPTSLPFIVIKNEQRVYVFADKVVTKLNSQKEYTNLMATIEAAYYALMISMKSNTFTMNRPLMLTLCNLYTLMVTLPLEQKVYMKGENLTKAMLYTIFYFYRIIDGPDRISPSTVAYKKIIADKVSESAVAQIVTDIKNMETNDFMNLIKLIMNINPVRYKNLDVMYMQHFVSSCGAPLVFALENPGYLFLAVTSSYYKSTVTSFNLNKILSALAKKIISLLGTI